MSTFELSIHTLENRETFGAGEKVEGEVHVRPNKTVTCNKLTLTLQRKGHGSGPADVVDIQTLELFSGELTAGEDHRFSYAIEIPAHGPCSYDGTVMKLDWFLVARADIPWKLDPKTSHRIQVEPSPSSTADWVASVLNTQESLQGGYVDPHWSLSLLGYGLGYSGFTLCLGFAGYSLLTYGWTWTFQLTLAVVFLGVGVIQSWSAFRHKIAERSLGAVELEFPPMLCPGDTLNVLLRTVPKRSVTVTGVSASIKAEEMMIITHNNQGNNAVEHTALSLDLDLEEGECKRYQEGEDIAFVFAATLPGDAPFSFSTRDLHLKWNLLLTLQASDLPTWTEEATLYVVPPAARDSILSQAA